MVDRCMRTDCSRCYPSRTTLDLRSLVIRLGAQLEESFLRHLSTIRFSLKIDLLVRLGGPLVKQGRLMTSHSRHKMTAYRDIPSLTLDSFT